MSEDAEEKRGIPAWVVTFADLMSLLMCFFVLLLAFSEIDATKFKQIASELSKAFGVQRVIPVLDPPKGTSPIFQNYIPSKQELIPSPIEKEGNQGGNLESSSRANAYELEKNLETTHIELLSEIENLFYSQIENGIVELLSYNDGRIILRLNESGYFDSGSAELSYELFDTLFELSKLLEPLKSPIEIHGHTDNVPINNDRFSSNWALSAARAVSVGELLIGTGRVSAERIRIVAFADIRPLIQHENITDEKRNRRVEIIILPIDSEAISQNFPLSHLENQDELTAVRSSWLF
ncbi:flagellar motor protein MotB [Marinobacter sp. NSM]|uniref:flagellar motor protein MotB n=1 Tax=Marinobacter sp. NSM TaxID=3458004 RepID=UPI004036B986